MTKKNLLILGAGGHAKVLIDCMRNQKDSMLGIVDTNSGLYGKNILSIPVLGDEDSIVNKYNPNDILLINGLGSIAYTKKRNELFHKFKQTGFKFHTVIHPTAYVAQDVVLGEGVQLITRSTIHVGSKIGDNVILNTHVSVNHVSFIIN